MFAVTDIAKGVAEGNFLLLAKTISQIENKVEGVDVYLTNLVPKAIPIIGITGPPGAGKSTLIAGLVGEWIAAGKKVAVLLVDPSSPFHKGAILGDRIRMKDWYLHPQVFIRSLASRGHLGGLNSSMIELTTLLQSVGFDQIIVETVGVGQSEVEVASLADTTVVVLVPEAGDEVQMMKSGLMEVADIFVVNKSDRPDAQTFTNHIRQMMMEHGVSADLVKVVATVASQGLGINDLIQAIASHQIANNVLGNYKKIIFTKAIQLIVAHKMQQLDLKKLEQDIEAATISEGFNIFSFTQNYF
ncbi:MAG: methylmalonyl Co-A mutase-associated GTPase MeaB [Chitinophagia bacterium]|jgi:LAO/AO transport system kinase|nr:methylmalonyl Co-A mutase-associated GTPase MeaB [Chitinophagia bacterium]